MDKMTLCHCKINPPARFVLVQAAAWPLRGIRAARTALLGVGGPCLLGLAYTWDRGTEPLAPPSLALAACLGATFALRTGLQSLAQQFVVSDWRHADH